MSTHSLDELKKKVLPLFKSEDPAFIRQGMLLVDTVLNDNPENFRYIQRSTRKMGHQLDWQIHHRFGGSCLAHGILAKLGAQHCIYSVENTV